MYLLRRIELHLRRSGIPPTRFGRDAIGDPCLVRDLRRGRTLREQTRGRIETYLAAQEAEEARPCKA